MPVHKSRVDTGEFHIGQGVDSEAFKQVAGAVRPHDIDVQDQPVGDCSTGSIESMEWRRHLRVNEMDEVVSSKQSAKLMEESHVGCSQELQHSISHTQEVQCSVNQVEQMTRFETRSWTGSADEVSLSQEEVQRSRAQEESDDEERMAREYRRRRVSDGAHSCSGLQGRSGSVALDSRSPGSVVKWTGSVGEFSYSQEVMIVRWLSDQQQWNCSYYRYKHKN